MNRTKYILIPLLAVLSALCFSVTALAEQSGSDLLASDSTRDPNLTVWIVVASVLAVLAVVSVILVNKRTAKYRKLFKKKKR